MFNLTTDERKALLFIMIFLAAGAVLKVLPFAVKGNKRVHTVQESINVSSNNKININTAKIEELVKLKGIGQSIALRIISYRKENGAFKSSEDLLKVKGIGEKKLSMFESKIIVK